MQKLAKAYKPKELAERAYLLYEQFRPALPEGVGSQECSGSEGDSADGEGDMIS